MSSGSKSPEGEQRFIQGNVGIAEQVVGMRLLVNNGIKAWFKLVKADKLCFLTSSFSDQQPLEGLLRPEATESHVAPVVLIDPQMARSPLVAFKRCLAGDAVGLFCQ